MCLTLCNPWTAARQAALSVTDSRSLPKLTSIESVMTTKRLILCRPLLLLPSVFPRIVSSSHQVAKVLEFPLQPQSFQFHNTLKIAMECYSAMKRKEILPFATTWVKPTHSRIETSPIWVLYAFSFPVKLSTDEYASFLDLRASVIIALSLCIISCLDSSLSQDTGAVQRSMQCLPRREHSVNICSTELLFPGPGHYRWLYNLFASVKKSLKTPEVGYITQLDSSTNSVPTNQPMKLARMGTSNFTVPQYGEKICLIDIFIRGT